MTRPLDGRPIENSYWFIDDEVLAGEYPGAYPGRGDSARDKLERFLDAGVRFFIDLTEPGESGLAPYAGLLAELAAERGVGVEHRRLSIGDVSVPKKPEQMAEILDAIDEARTAGTLAYVHCWGGTGRTGTVIGCWLRRQGRSHEEALAELRARWGTMAKAPHRPGTPDTPAQERYIRDWPELDPGPS